MHHLSSSDIDLRVNPEAKEGLIHAIHLDYPWRKLGVFRRLKDAKARRKRMHDAIILLHSNQFVLCTRPFASDFNFFLDEEFPGAHVYRFRELHLRGSKPTRKPPRAEAALGIHKARRRARAYSGYLVFKIVL
jgi:hypothetical protein